MPSTPFFQERPAEWKGHLTVGYWSQPLRGDAAFQPCRLQPWTKWLRLASLLLSLSSNTHGSGQQTFASRDCPDRKYSPGTTVVSNYAALSAQ